MSVKSKEGGHHFSVPSDWSTGWYYEIEEEEYRRLDKVGDDYAEKYLAEHYTAEDMEEIERLRNDPHHSVYSEDKLNEYNHDKGWAWRVAVRKEIDESLSDSTKYGYGYGSAGIAEKDGKFYWYVYVYNNCD